MSQIGNKAFLNTTFPDSKQSLPIFADLSPASQTTYLRYLKAVLEGNESDANMYLQQMPDETKINAAKMNIINDTISAIQEVFGSTSAFEEIVNQKQSEWQNEIDKFKVEPEPSSYAYVRLYDNTYGQVIETYYEGAEWSSSTTYKLNSVVYYGNPIYGKFYKSLSNNNLNINPTNTQYWKEIYKKYTIVKVSNGNKVDGLIGAGISQSQYGLYMALEDITSPRVFDTRKWAKLTKEGTKGVNGGSFNFLGEWDFSINYVIGDLVVYNNYVYAAITENIDSVPSESSTDWRREFNIEPQYIPVQAEEPTGQQEGDLWFKIAE